MRTLEANDAHDFYLLGDVFPHVHLPKNVRFMNISRADLDTRVHAVIGKHAGTSNSHGYYVSKLSDWKPLFGEIFADLLKPCKWWGVMQEDQLLGNVSAFLTPSIMAAHDIVSPLPRPFYHCGPFMLYKNTPRVTQLWRSSKDWRWMASRSGYSVFDEWWGGKNKMQFRDNMPRVVQREASARRISAFTAPLWSAWRVSSEPRPEQEWLRDDTFFGTPPLRWLNPAFSVTWRDGTLWLGEPHASTQLLVAHFMLSKRRPDLGKIKQTPSLAVLLARTTEFTLTPHGFWMIELPRSGTAHAHKCEAKAATALLATGRSSAVLFSVDAAHFRHTIWGMARAHAPRFPPARLAADELTELQQNATRSRDDWGLDNGFSIGGGGDSGAGINYNLNGSMITSSRARALSSAPFDVSIVGPFALPCVRALILQLAHMDLKRFNSTLDFGSLNRSHPLLEELKFHHHHPHANVDSRSVAASDRGVYLHYDAQQPPLENTSILHGDEADADLRCAERCAVLAELANTRLQQTRVCFSTNPSGHSSGSSSSTAQRTPFAQNGSAASRREERLHDIGPRVSSLSTLLRISCDGTQQQQTSQADQHGELVHTHRLHNAQQHAHRTGQPRKGSCERARLRVLLPYSQPTNCRKFVSDLPSAACEQCEIAVAPLTADSGVVAEASCCHTGPEMHGAWRLQCGARVGAPSCGLGGQEPCAQTWEQGRRSCAASTAEATARAAIVTDADGIAIGVEESPMVLNVSRYLVSKFGISVREKGSQLARQSAMPGTRGLQQVMIGAGAVNIQEAWLAHFAYGIPLMPCAGGSCVRVANH